ncbi:MAG TPA: hypothetical protein VFA18_10260, partial [Gemmataceae bacterium]|nr:hypothetical protein [Gemmataceae bacterium]
AFALLLVKEAYQQAKTFGILAPENPVLGRWVATEFVRDGHKVPLPKQPENPPPQRVLPSKWKGGAGMPAVIRFAIMPYFVTVMFEDGTGVSYRTTSKPGPELVLTKTPAGEPVARLGTSFPQPGVMVLEGPFDGQQVRLTLRKIAAPKKDYQLRTRGFRWVQEHPYNR